MLGSVLSPFSSPHTELSVEGNTSDSMSIDRAITPDIPVPLPPPYLDTREDTPAIPAPAPEFDSDSNVMTAAHMARSMQSLPAPRPAFNSSVTSHHKSSFTALPSRSVNPVHAAHDKPLASANGISCSIKLAEPHVYLTGFDLENRSSSGQNSTALIRGTLVLNITKSIKIKAVTLSFCGRARTEWPEGKHSTARPNCSSLTSFRHSSSQN